MKETGTLVPRQASDVVLAIPAQPMQLFDGLQIFARVPQYQMHVKVAGDPRTMDHEAREHIIY